MPSYDITIQATVTKTIRVNGAESEQAAIETAHQNFNVGENGPEKYDEQCLGAKLLTLEEVSDRIKAEYLASGPRASDVDWAVGELMAHCGRLFETPEHARSFLMEETHENLEKPE